MSGAHWWAWRRIGALLALVLAVVVTSCSDEGGSSMGAVDEARVALEMVQVAAASQGLDAPVEIRTVSTTDALGAENGRKLAVRVRLEVDGVEPIDLAEVSSLWQGRFGFEPNGDMPEVRYFVEGDRTAQAGDNSVLFGGGSGRVWFESTTGFFEPTAAQAAATAING